MKQLTKEEECLLYRYAYYVQGCSLISDQEYDKVWSKYEKGVGSDIEKSYPSWVRAEFFRQRSDWRLE